MRKTPPKHRVSSHRHACGSPRGSTRVATGRSERGGIHAVLPAAARDHTANASGLVSRQWILALRARMTGREWAEWAMGMPCP
jgi:hypothetical protein